MKILGTDFVTYYVSDFHAAVMFYRDVLGLPLQLCSDEQQWAEFNCGNVTLALKGGTELSPSDHAPASRWRWKTLPLPTANSPRKACTSSVRPRTTVYAATWNCSTPTTT